MIAFWLYKHEVEVTFSYIDLREDPNCKLEVVKARNTFGALYGVNEIQICISYLW